MFTTALFATAKSWKQPTCPLSNEQINTMWSVNAKEYYGALKSKASLTHATARLNSEAIMLSEKNPSQKGQILYESTYMRSLEQSNSQRQEVGWCLPGAGGWGGEELVLSEDGVSAGRDADSSGGAWG